MIQYTQFLVSNRDGWRLGLRRVVDDRAQQPHLRPLLFVPGYCMNTFLFGYHPAGNPVEEYLAAAGFEVWSMALRAQDGSEPEGDSSGNFGLRDVAAVDIPVAIAHLLAHSSHQAVDLIGCSLGGTMVFTHLALQPDSPVGSVVAVGAPLRWIKINPLIKTAFSSTSLARHLPIRGMRGMAKRLLPLLRHAPWLMSIYMHPNIIDMDKADQFVQVVEDPNPQLNEEIARWIHHGDLVIDGTNITEALRDMDHPLLVLTGNADGIVPAETARFVLHWVASRRKNYVEVGDRRRKFAHADLYISRYSHELVFEPLSKWLLAGYEPPH
ncbi:MAG: alpha/beta hydrolase [Proteobacteria bacterium]|nr:alpha/beta hydrolase [Pseudomonadota bacterium]